MELNNLLNQTGNNTIWRVSGLADFIRILPEFTGRARASGRHICYIHFSEQSVFPLSEEAGTAVCHVPLNHRFEAFTVEVFTRIEEQPEGTFFIFDSLSDLQTAWATDLMMENFFRVITPLIRRKSSGAFFPLVRSMHSQSACEEIQKHADVFADLYSDFNSLYLSCIKLPESVSDETSFQPHYEADDSDGFIPISDGSIMSRFLQAVSADSRLSPRENRDAWEQFFDKTQKKFENGQDVDAECARMGKIMMSRDHNIREMLKKHFSPVDYFNVREHMVGTGLIGGKACGMLIARKIIENCRPDIYERFEAHDSFFIGSDVFYSYIVDNDFWDLRVKQRTPEGYFSLAGDFADKLRSGSFSEKIRKEFIRVLEYYGNCPIIVRSSSILEDGFGNAFAGKYDSVFCMGTGTLEERLEEFENAIRVVYASTMSQSALDYRLRRGLADRDEQMSLLVMRVSGSFYGDYYFPCAAGVGYSYSTYRFLDSLDPASGMLRLVMGLGTSAVDRAEGSYPRLVSMDKPQATSYKTVQEHHKFSQRKVEVINTKTSQMERVDPEILRTLIPVSRRNQLYEHDYEAERIFTNRGQRRDITFVSCPGLVRNKDLMDNMKGLMQTIQSEYNQPVDIEFTINLDNKGNYLINLLQCRPLQVFRDSVRKEIPNNIPEENVLLDISGASMGMSQVTDIDLVIWVDPVGYYNMPYNDKVQVAKSIGRINWKLRNEDRKILLFAPGRLGSSSPELGVPAVFANISSFTAVFEVAESRVGYNPELSYGSHMFQDLVENSILYAAVFENEKTKKYRPEFFYEAANRITDYDTEGESLKDIIHVIDAEKITMYHDMLNEHLVIAMGDK